MNLKVDPAGFLAVIIHQIVRNLAVPHANQMSIFTPDKKTECLVL